MIDPNFELLSTVVIAAAGKLTADPDASGAWDEVRAARKVTQDDDADLELVVETEDLAELKVIIDEWLTEKRHLPACDRAVLKRAMKAFRKSLKVTQLAAETKLGGGPFSSGSDSQVVGIQPPPRYPLATWLELVRQKRLATDRHQTTFELGPAG